MNAFQIVALLTTLVAVFSYLNYRMLKLPMTIGLMLISLLFSLSLILASHLGLNFAAQADAIIKRIDFNRAFMQGMLSFLLFAGALHVNFDNLLQQKWTIGTFATIGVLISTMLIGSAMYVLLAWIGLPLSFLHCLLFGALVSPTDPIAVLGLLKQNKAPESLATNIAGESLFNDGVGVVVFLVIYETLSGEYHFDLAHIGILLVQEALGGIILGLVLGWVTYRLLKSIDNYQVEILLTLALVSGGYAFATAWHVSGLLAIVVAGLLIGNHGRMFAMSETTRYHLDTFWELVDEILNATLFVLIGLEIAVVTLSVPYLLAGLLAIPIILLARFISVGIPVFLFRTWRDFTPHVVKIMTWGGLRGGISVALALSLPSGAGRDLILTITYAVVVFSILAQGLTIAPLLRKAMPVLPQEAEQVPVA